MKITCGQRGLRGDLAFVSTGYHNWKAATDSRKGFTKHEHSTYHLTAIQALSNKSDDIGELLSDAHRAEKDTNRQMLLHVLSTVRYLARQGLAFRGHNDDASNFMQLLKFRCDDIPEMRQWLENNSRKYTSHDIQNEMVELMGQTILHQVIDGARKSDFYSIMVDETRDISNREQLVICLQWTDEFLMPHKDFVGLYQIDRADASTIAAVVKDVLIRLQMPLDKCRGRCYDGCSTMSGHKNGFAAIIKKDEPQALLTHCYGHALNLAASDAVMQCGHMKDLLDTVYEITKLVKFPPKREAQLRNIKAYFGNDCDEKDAPNIRILCLTRWTVRAQALRSIMENYKSLLTLWEEVLDDCRDSDIKARTIGGSDTNEKV